MSAATFGNPETTDLLMRVLDGQDRVNDGLLSALESLALQADKYDAQISGLTDSVATMQREILRLRGDVELLERKARNDGLHRRAH